MPKLRLVGAAFLVTAFSASEASAFQRKASDLPVTSSADFARNPKSFHERGVHLRDAYCVDPGGTGFICIIATKAGPVRVRASSLGYETIDDIAEDLIGPCKGTANLTNQACRFDIQILPTNSEREMVETTAGSQQVVSVSSNTIDMYRPKRR